MLNWSNSILQFSLLIFLLFCIHIYFLIAKLSNKNESLKLNIYDFYIIISGTTIAVILFGILSIDLLKNYLINNTLLNFINNWKDLATVLIALSTVLALSYQTRQNQRLTLMQIKENKELLDQQIINENKNRRIEILINNMDSLYNETRILISEIITIPKINILLAIDKYNKENTLTLEYRRHENNFDKKNSTVLFKDTKFKNILNWDSATNFLGLIIEKGDENLYDEIENNHFYELKIISSNLKRLIEICSKLVAIDEDLFFSAKISLEVFSSQIKDLNKIGLIDNLIYKKYKKIIEYN